MDLTISADSGQTTEYLSNVRQTLYWFVMSTVYSDDICLRYIYGIFGRYSFTLYLRFLLFVEKTFIYTQKIPKI